MKIPLESFSKIITTLTDHIRDRLLGVDETAPDLNDKGGIDVFAEIHCGNGVYIMLQVTATVFKKEPAATERPN